MCDAFTFISLVFMLFIFDNYLIILFLGDLKKKEKKTMLICA